MASIDEIFKRLVKLVGSEVEVGNRMGSALKGTVAYSMPDSFILNVNGKPNILRFDEISYLREVPKN